MSEEGSAGSRWVERHPVLATLQVVFAAGAVAGAVLGQGNSVLSALIGGLGGVVLFFFLSAALALIITLVQLVILRVGQRATKSPSRNNPSLVRRVKRNFEGATEMWIQGWQ